MITIQTIEIQIPVAVLEALGDDGVEELQEALEDAVKATVKSIHLKAVAKVVE